MTLRVSALACLVALGLAVTATAADAVEVAGKWSGTWKNSLGQSGNDTLELTEDEDGILAGLWTGEVKVKGKRINRNTIELRGKTATRSYQVTASVNKDGVMLLKYVVTRLDGEGSYDGTSRLEME